MSHGRRQEWAPRCLPKGLGGRRGVSIGFLTFPVISVASTDFSPDSRPRAPLCYTFKNGNCKRGGYALYGLHRRDDDALNRTYSCRGLCQTPAVKSSPLHPGGSLVFQLFQAVTSVTSAQSAIRLSLDFLRVTSRRLLRITSVDGRK